MSFQLSFILLYFYCEDRRKALSCVLASLLWSGRKHQVCKEMVVQCTCHGNLGMQHLLCHRHTSSRFVFLHHALTVDLILERSVRVAFSIITIILSVSRAECLCKPWKQSEFLRECSADLRVFPLYSDLSWSRRLLYPELVEQVTKDCFVAGSACRHLSYALSGLRCHRRTTSASLSFRLHGD